MTAGFGVLRQAAHGADKKLSHGAACAVSLDLDRAGLKMPTGVQRTQTLTMKAAVAPTHARQRHPDVVDDGSTIIR